MHRTRSWQRCGTRGRRTHAGARNETSATLELKLLHAMQTEADSQATMSTSHRHEKSALEELVDTFDCPLSMELMQDPVITPSGVTYERMMIERHLDINGSFDPITRHLLTKALLYPNRALQVVMQLLLQDPRTAPIRALLLDSEQNIHTLSMELNSTSLSTPSHVNSQRK